MSIVCAEKVAYQVQGEFNVISPSDSRKTSATIGRVLMLESRNQGSWFSILRVGRCLYVFGQV